MHNLPPAQLGRAIKYYLQGRINFDRKVVGQIRKDDHDDYEIFRKVILQAPEEVDKEPEATFRVTFNFKSLSASINKKLSLLPIPFIVAQNGFRSKTWMLGKKTGRFQGLYEWDTAEDARQYWHSFPMKMMKRRAISSTMKYEIEENRNISS
jgi:hypothetical protein